MRIHTYIFIHTYIHTYMYIYIGALVAQHVDVLLVELDPPGARYQLRLATGQLLSLSLSLFVAGLNALIIEGRPKSQVRSASGEGRCNHH